MAPGATQGVRRLLGRSVLVKNHHGLLRVAPPNEQDFAVELPGPSVIELSRWRRRDLWNLMETDEPMKWSQTRPQ